MQYRVFFVRAVGDDFSEEELNTFLRSHQITSVQKRFVEDGLNSYWSLCVEYGDGGKSIGKQSGSKIDYREVLSDDEFKIFAKLRVLRKRIAEQEGLPVFAVFTNEQLAHISRSNITSKADIERIDGIGRNRAEKYFDSIVEALSQKGENEKNRQFNPENR